MPLSSNTYDQCMAQAFPVSRYMRDVYATSSGEIHCLVQKKTSRIQGVYLTMVVNLP